MIATLALAWVGLQAPVTFKLDVRVGDAWALESRERYFNAVEEFDETDVWSERAKVVKVDPLGADIEVERALVRTEVNGDAIPPIKGTLPENRKIRVRVLGGYAPEGGVKPLERRLSRANALGVHFPEGPANVGKQWSLEWAQADQVPSARASWHYQRVEQIADRPMAAIAFRLDEDTAFDRALRIEGTRWVDVETGLVLQERSTAHGFPVPGGSFLVDRITTTTLRSFRRGK